MDASNINTDEDLVARQVRDQSEQSHEHLGIEKDQDTPFADPMGNAGGDPLTGFSEKQEEKAKLD
ncbi:hypothetical protein AAVH_13593 [Aphelenchoides avenae]|nr:hypothetical protein AAVH_19377 [Aphelenchus avenae]KAH7718923.1 hypothetical protein AAVH_13593 [Aphelenchus avenae]